SHLHQRASRPAEDDTCLSWQADLVEDRSRQVPGRVEVLAHLVARAWPAVTNISSAVRKREHEATDFGGKWMMLSIASRVQPQDLPCRAGRRESLEHRQNRCCPNSRAEQHERPLSGLQNEASARRAYVESIAHPDMLPQVRSCRPIRLHLHADSVALRREGTRE